MRLFLIFIIIIFAIGIGYIWYSTSQTPAEGPNGANGTGSVDTSDWETYTNEEFGFSISHPPDWQVHEAPDDLIEPKFNIYKPGSDQDQLPYTHHSQGVTHVSVFPQGIPTEGVFSESKDSSVEFAVPVVEAIDFVLSDGTVWATYANVEDAPGSWGEPGFIFAQLEIENHETDCIQDGEPVSMEECEPLMGDQIIHHGSVNEQDRAIQEEMLASFELQESSAPATYRDVLRVEEPRPDEAVSSPLTVRGAARGLWYFEASFPVRLLDGNDNEVPLDPGFIMTDQEWMTEEFVPFEAELTFEAPDTETGTLILEKANPSGLPENEDSFSMPVRFAQ